MDHANGSRCVERVVIAVESTKLLVEAYEKTFGFGRVNTTDEVLTVHLGRQRIVFAGLDDLESMYPELDFGGLSLPRPVVLTLGVREVEATSDFLAGAQIPFIDTPGGPVVEPDEACGVALEFV